MRFVRLLIPLLLTACMDPIGSGPATAPPRPPDPVRRSSVIDEIDSARRAAEAEAMVIDDPRLRDRTEDSLTQANSDSLVDRMLRARRGTGR